jgi:hypothetical protein
MRITPLDGTREPVRASAIDFGPLCMAASMRPVQSARSIPVACGIAGLDIHRRRPARSRHAGTDGLEQGLALSVHVEPRHAPMHRRA